MQTNILTSIAATAEKCRSVFSDSRKQEGVEKPSPWKRLCVGFLVCAATAIASPAQITFTKLQDFDGPNGAQPAYMSLIQGIDGYMFGTTQAGGTYSQGSIFALTTAGALGPLHDFCAVLNGNGYCTDGAVPYGGLVQAADGTFYGTTSLGGDGGLNGGDNGTIFKFTWGTTPQLTPIYNFQYTDGAYPYAGLVQGSGDIFYGTTYEGGTGHSGTIFSITAGATPAFKSLYNFCLQSSCPDGAYPISGLVETANGTLYGTTSFTAFNFSPGPEKLNTLDPFCIGTSCDTFDGPYGTLIQGNDGSFYGTTSGGTTGYGTIFKITPGGSPVFKTLYTFCSDPPSCPDGSKPTGTLVQGSDGIFYGTTQNGGANSNHGTIFKFTPDPTPALVTLYSFCAQPACADGSQPYGGLIQDTNGTFFGTTFSGGAHGDGTIFSLSVGLGPFVETKTTFGKEQAHIGILGQGFSSSSVVEFGGTAATSVTRTGTTFISAAVPPDAQTGPVTVTTTLGTLTSNKTFHVTPTISSFSPAMGPVGTVVTINGTGLMQMPKVTFFDGKSVTPSMISDTQIMATVPTGAMTGKIKVTTPGGSVSTTTNFTVN